MHDAGFLHADLTPRNLLVEEASLVDGAPRFWVIDLDRSEFHHRLSPGQRVDNLARLLRHALRRDHRQQLGLRRTDLRRFLAGYEPTERWKALWHQVERRHRSGRWLHGLGGLLERRIG
jgi:tRNA A-37 threonylcarbamoyl transferase component Bud32